MTDETRPEGTDPVDSPTCVATAAEEGTEEKPPKLTQTVELKDIGPCKKHIKVVIERTDIDRLLNKKFSELVTDSNVAGFRPGKAPRRIIEKRFQKEVTDQVRGEILLQSLEQLAEENDVAPLAAPDINPSKIEIPKEGPLVYEFDVEVRPEFDLPDYKRLKIKRTLRTFSDDDVAAELKRILGPYGQLVPKPAGKAELGDYLVTDLMTRDGELVLSKHQEITVRVDPTLALKDAVCEKFGEMLVGVDANETRTVELVLSDTVATPALRGRKVQAIFEVKEVKSLRLPELTHAFLHNFGVHSEDQFRERIHVLLDRRHEYQQRQSAREQVLAHLAGSATWELPRDLLLRQARRAFSRRLMEMRSGGISEEEIRGRQRLLERDVLASTESSLKEHFVLQKIAETEKIDVNEDDLDDEIERIAMQKDESPRKVRARFEKEDLMEALATELIERKALDLILESAQYEDVTEIQAPAPAFVTTVEEQAVPGEMHDPTAPPAEPEPKADSDAPTPSQT